MSIPASDEFDLAATIGLWIPVPGVDDGVDIPAWARERATDWAAGTGSSISAIDRVTGFLVDLVNDARPSGFRWRLAFVLDPDLGAAVVDLALADVPDDIDLGSIVETNAAEDLGNTVTEFAGNGHCGAQGVRFVLDPSQSDERAIQIEATLVVRREVPPYGSVLVIARARSTHLMPTSAALVPLQHLLTADELLALVSGA